MRKVLGLFVLLALTSTANATVVLNDFSITETNLSFNVSGTVSQKGSSYQHQLMFGLVDNADDWITSFDAGASTFAEGPGNANPLTGLYTLSGSWTDSLLTYSYSGSWNIGDTINIDFDFVGVFNLANFDPNNFGMSVGLNTNGNIVPGDLNLVTAVNTSSVPAPATLALLGLGLLGLGVSRKRHAT